MPSHGGSPASQGEAPPSPMSPFGSSHSGWITPLRQGDARGLGESWRKATAIAINSAPVSHGAVCLAPGFGAVQSRDNRWHGISVTDEPRRRPGCLFLCSSKAAHLTAVPELLPRSPPEAPRPVHSLGSNRASLDAYILFPSFEYRTTRRNNAFRPGYNRGGGGKTPAVPKSSVGRIDRRQIPHPRAVRPAFAPGCKGRVRTCGSIPTSNPRDKTNVSSSGTAGVYLT